MNLLILFIGGLILTFGDIIMKKWVISNSPITYIQGMILYLVGLNFLAYSFRQKDIAVASVIFIVFNVVTLAIAGKILFDESLSTVKIVSMTLALSSIVVMEVFG